MDGTAADVDEMLRLAVLGDRQAFEAMVREYGPMVYSLAFHFLRDEGDAEEVGQEVFLDLHRSLKSLDSGAHVANWLRRVATHRCIDFARKRRPQLALEDIGEQGSSPTVRDPLLSDLLRRLVGCLPDNARAVVVLRYQEDLDPSEIAHVLQMPLNTVKSHLQRSLQTLRTKLDRTQVRI